MNFSDPFGLCPKGEVCRRYTFAHLSSVAVKVGDQLDPGATVGESGNTGRSTGAHLHYEVGNVDASGKYTPDLQAGPATDGCPIADCSSVSSRPAGQRTLTVNGETVTRAHNGTDLKVPTGTTVTAPGGGEVIRAGPQDKDNLKKGFGIRVTVDVVIPRDPKK